MKPIPKKLGLKLAPLLLLLASSPVASAWYDPGLQRWINRDPSQETGGCNLYRYANASPVDAIDNYGLGVIYIQKRDGTATVEITPSQPRQRSTAEKIRDAIVPNPKETYKQADEAFGIAADPGRQTHERVAAGIAGTCIIVLGVVECVPGDGAATKPLKTKCLATARNNLLHVADNNRLRSAINALYREGAKLGSGSSMDALRIEGSHLQKVFDRQKQLQRILKEEALTDKDRQIVKDLINDIQNSIQHYYNKP